MNVVFQIMSLEGISEGQMKELGDMVKQAGQLFLYEDDKELMNKASFIDKHNFVNTNIPSGYVPRVGEFVVLADDVYFEVIRVVHFINDSRLKDIYVEIVPKKENKKAK